MSGNKSLHRVIVQKKEMLRRQGAGYRDVSGVYLKASISRKQFGGVQGKVRKTGILYVLSLLTNGRDIPHLNSFCYSLNR